MAKPAAENIRVLIADDHAIVREGLKQIISDSANLVVAYEAGSAQQAIQRLRSSHGEIDILLLDISLPDKNGIEVLKRVRKEFPAIAVLILTMHREDQYALRAIKAGASGYLNKQSVPAELVTALREVTSGRKYISPSLAQELANRIGTDEGDQPHESLSDREYQTLLMIASGKTVGDIANDLSLSPKTISMYRSRLLQKMNMRHNAELTHYAISYQLLPELIA